MYDVAFKVLFSKIERFLIRNSHEKFVIEGNDKFKEDKRKGGDSTTSSDWVPDFIEFETQSRIFNQLYSGVFPRTSAMKNRHRSSNVTSNTWYINFRCLFDIPLRLKTLISQLLH